MAINYGAFATNQQCLKANKLLFKVKLNYYDVQRELFESDTPKSNGVN